MTIHLQLEERLAAFKQTEAAVVFQSGFTANAGTVSSILTRDDVIAERARSAVSALTPRFPAAEIAPVQDLEQATGVADGLVNATPVGMSKYPGMPIRAEWLRPDLWVADIVYFPAETELLVAARGRGARTLSGAGMAVHQAAKAFELFTGNFADAREMERQFT